MQDQPYKRPPITEAVIEIRFAAPPIEAADLDKASRSLASSYPLQQPVKSFGVAVGIPPGPEDRPTAQISEEIGHRLSSQDLSEILLLWPFAIVVSQLAPYPGWDSFFGRFVRDWTSWKKIVGFRRLSRVGVRFINRIDIPVTNGIIEESEYMSVYPALPAALGPITGYGVQIQSPIRDVVGCNLVINSAAVPSPLLGHSSFVLDLDISREVNTPQKDDEIYKLLNQIRDKKNEVFEACFTDKAKELFKK